tara:strand:- start:4794 stop:10085 length:5292 start_codon:yes stop_codon:yes gene_type:complete
MSSLLENKCEAQNIPSEICQQRPKGKDDEDEPQPTPKPPPHKPPHHHPAQPLPDPGQHTGPVLVPVGHYKPPYYNAVPIVEAGSEAGLGARGVIRRVLKATKPLWYDKFFEHTFGKLSPQHSITIGRHRLSVAGVQGDERRVIDHQTGRTYRSGMRARQRHATRIGQEHLTDEQAEKLEGRSFNMRGRVIHSYLGDDGKWRPSVRGRQLAQVIRGARGTKVALEDAADRNSEAVRIAKLGKKLVDERAVRLKGILKSTVKGAVSKPLSERRGGVAEHLRRNFHKMMADEEPHPFNDKGIRALGSRMENLGQRLATGEVPGETPEQRDARLRQFRHVRAVQGEGTELRQSRIRLQPPDNPAQVVDPELEELANTPQSEEVQQRMADHARRFNKSMRRPPPRGALPRSVNFNEARNTSTAEQASLRDTTQAAARIANTESLEAHAAAMAKTPEAYTDGDEFQDAPNSTLLSKGEWRATGTTPAVNAQPNDRPIVPGETPNTLVPKEEPNSAPTEAQEAASADETKLDTHTATDTAERPVWRGGEMTRRHERGRDPKFRGVQAQQERVRAMRLGLEEKRTRELTKEEKEQLRADDKLRERLKEAHLRKEAGEKLRAKAAAGRKLMGKEHAELRQLQEKARHEEERIREGRPLIETPEERLAELRRVSQEERLRGAYRRSNITRGMPDSASQGTTLSEEEIQNRADNLANTFRRTERALKTTHFHANQALDHLDKPDINSLQQGDLTSEIGGQRQLLAHDDTKAALAANAEHDAHTALQTAKAQAVQTPKQARRIRAAKAALANDTDQVQRGEGDLGLDETDAAGKDITSSDVPPPPDPESGSVGLGEDAAGGDVWAGILSWTAKKFGVNGTALSEALGKVGATKIIGSQTTNILRASKLGKTILGTGRVVGVAGKIANLPQDVLMKVLTAGGRKTIASGAATIGTRALSAIKGALNPYGVSSVASSTSDGTQLAEGDTELEEEAGDEGEVGVGETGAELGEVGGEAGIVGGMESAEATFLTVPGLNVADLAVMAATAVIGFGVGAIVNALVNAFKGASLPTKPGMVCLNGNVEGVGTQWTKNNNNRAFNPASGTTNDPGIVKSLISTFQNALAQNQAIVANKGQVLHIPGTSWKKWSTASGGKGVYTPTAAEVKAWGLTASPPTQSATGTWNAVDTQVAGSDPLKGIGLTDSTYSTPWGMTSSQAQIEPWLKTQNEPDVVANPGPSHHYGFIPSSSAQITAAKSSITDLTAKLQQLEASQHPQANGKPPAPLYYVVSNQKVGSGTAAGGTRYATHLITRLSGSGLTHALGAVAQSAAYNASTGSTFTPTCYDNIDPNVLMAMGLSPYYGKLYYKTNPPNTSKGKGTGGGEGTPAKMNALIDGGEWNGGSRTIGIAAGWWNAPPEMEFVSGKQWSMPKSLVASLHSLYTIYQEGGNALHGELGGANNQNDLNNLLLGTGSGGKGAKGGDSGHDDNVNSALISTDYGTQRDDTEVTGTLPTPEQFQAGMVYIHNQGISEEQTETLSDLNKIYQNMTVGSSGYAEAKFIAKMYAYEHMLDPISGDPMLSWTPNPTAKQRQQGASSIGMVDPETALSTEEGTLVTDQTNLSAALTTLQNAEDATTANPAAIAAAQKVYNTAQVTANTAQNLVTATKATLNANIAAYNKTVTGNNLDIRNYNQELKRWVAHQVDHSAMTQEKIFTLMELTSKEGVSFSNPTKSLINQMYQQQVMPLEKKLAAATLPTVSQATTGTASGGAVTATDQPTSHS